MTEPSGAVRPHALTYQSAGVDTEAKTRLLSRLADTIRATHSDNVAAGIGAFAGALRLPAGEALVFATVDGVGTKTLLARRAGLDRVIGWDAVAHCANDIVSQGARPVAFLDYIAMGRLVPAVVEEIVGAAAEACRALGVALLGGETAEMPGAYVADAYDVVGMMIGLAPPDGLITGDEIAPGDRLIGLASTGLHTNGYSLARRVLDEAGVRLDDRPFELDCTVGEALLAPHRCYAPAVLALTEFVRPKGIAHITGGGLRDNLIRPLPEGCRARVWRSWPEPPIFAFLRRAGNIPEEEMIATFNLGIGMVLVVSARDAACVIAHFEAQGIPAFEIGEIVSGARGVELP
ncbi:MAG: phosphoribosylformylglycinamidine cyclo-ligase [Armatimonadota bacterium]